MVPNLVLARHIQPGNIFFYQWIPLIFRLFSCISPTVHAVSQVFRDSTGHKGYIPQYHRMGDLNRGSNIRKLDGDALSVGTLWYYPHPFKTLHFTFTDSKTIMFTFKYIIQGKQSIIGAFKRFLAALSSSIPLVVLLRFVTRRLWKSDL